MLMNKFFRFVKRLYIWAPILWQDRDYDYTYLLRIMSFKISLMRKEISTNNRHTSAMETAKQMRLTELYLNRLADDTTSHCNEYFCTCPDKF